MINTHFSPNQENPFSFREWATAVLMVSPMAFIVGSCSTGNHSSSTTANSPRPYTSSEQGLIDDGLRQIHRVDKMVNGAPSAIRSKSFAHKARRVDALKTLGINKATIVQALTELDIKISPALESDDDDLNKLHELYKDENYRNYDLAYHYDEFFPVRDLFGGGFFSAFKAITYDDYKGYLEAMSDENLPQDFLNLPEEIFADHPETNGSHTHLHEFIKKLYPQNADDDTKAQIVCNFYKLFKDMEVFIEFKNLEKSPEGKSDEKFQKYINSQKFALYQEFRTLYGNEPKPEKPVKLALPRIKDDSADFLFDETLPQTKDGSVDAF